MLVDDEIWTLRDMEMLLRDVPGFHLSASFTNPLEAIEAIRREKPNVVLTDLKMEEMSGQSLMNAVHELSPDTRLIICSAYRDFDAARDAIKLNVADYLLKPIVREDFLRAFENVRRSLAVSAPPLPVYSKMRISFSETDINEAPPFAFDSERLDQHFCLLRYENSASMEEWIHCTKNIGFSREFTREADIEIACKEALAAYCADFVYTAHETIGRLQSYIAVNYSKKLTLGMLADTFNFSSAYLCDMFTKKCGTQLFSFIKQVRHEMACFFLRTTAYTVREIAQKVGYEDTSHFCREFKTIKGLTPNQFRMSSARNIRNSH